MTDTTTSTAFRTQVTATLSVKNWVRAMDFYKAAFGARETYSVPGGGVARLSVSGAEFWVAEESAEHLNLAPRHWADARSACCSSSRTPRRSVPRPSPPVPLRWCRWAKLTGGASVASSIRPGITGRSAGS